MKKLLSALWVILAATAPVFAISWDSEDPMKGARALLSEVPAVPPPQAAPVAAAPEHIPGRFPMYVLALSWAPAFCTTKPSTPECVSQTADRFDAKNMVLHGLWPNIDNDPKHTYAYCGVDPALKDLNWSQLPPRPISDGLMSRLRTHMPGVASFLQNHEWYTHGSCSGMGTEDYFDTADRLVTDFAQSRAGHYVSTHAGGTMDAAELLGEFEKDFGPGSSGSVRLFCLKQTNKLIELHVYLKNSPDLKDGFAGQFAAPDAGEVGTCPQAVELLSPKN